MVEPPARSSATGTDAPARARGGDLRYCLGCRYALRDLADGRCPECGRAFDPADRSTTAATPHGDLRSALASATRALGVGAIVFAIALVIASALGVDLLLTTLAVCALSPLAVALLVLVLVPGVPIRRRTRVASLLAIALIASVPTTIWPFRAMFALHRSTFQARVDATPPGAPHALVATNTRVGLYRVREVRISPNGGVGFQLSGNAGGGTYLVRVAPGDPTPWWNTNWLIDLGGGWWLVEQD